MTSDCPTAEFVGSSWRRDQHARKGSQHCIHCHSAVNARGCTLRAEWQCHPHCHSMVNARGCTPSHCHSTSNARGCTPSHCHSTSSVPKRCAQGRVAVPPTRDYTLRPKWQCPSHCHSTSNARAARPCTATRRRAYRNGALGPEWQCRPRVAARSGPSGSAPYTATRRRAYRNGTLGPEWQCRPRGAARSGPSGSAGSGGLRASSRCADARTRLQDVSRASGSRALFETDPLRAVERLLARQVGMAVQLASPM